MDKQAILSMIERIEASLTSIKSILNEDDKLRPKQSPKQLQKQPPKTEETRITSIPIPKIQDPLWPIAIDEYRIPKSVSDKKHRAINIIRSTATNFEDKNILDYGCGDGYFISEVTDITKKAIGYDIHADKAWAEHKIDKSHLTTDIKEIEARKPYDFILLYDVIDHAEKEPPEAIFTKLREFLSPNGVIYVKCHPWTAKHGGHLYEQCNKAYLHLALTEEELHANNLSIPHNLKINRPMATYESWFAKAGLSIVDKKVNTDHVDKYFDGPLLDRIMNLNWANISREDARKIMHNQFIHYWLKKV